MLSQYNVALMHVINHAFFKALLFLGAGAVIHSFSDQQTCCNTTKLRAIPKA